MSNDLYKISQIDAPEYLLKKVIDRVKQEKKLALLKRRLFLSFIVFSASSTVFIPLIYWFKLEFNQSGFFEYLSLIYLDFNIVTTYWQDFSLALLETIPAIALSATLTILAIILYSGRNLIRLIKELKITTHLI